MKLTWLGGVACAVMARGSKRNATAVASGVAEKGRILRKLR
jgi:hypothetical protein